MTLQNPSMFGKDIKKSLTVLSSYVYKHWKRI